MSMPIDWQRYIDSNPRAFINFYSSSCKSSQKSKPKFEKAAQYFNNIPFISVNCFNVLNKPICDRFNIASTPTFIIINGNSSEVREFYLKRTKHSFIYALERSLNVSSTYSLNQIKYLDYVGLNSTIQSKKCSVVLYKYTFEVSMILTRRLRILSKIYENDADKLNFVFHYYFPDINNKDFDPFLPGMVIYKNGSLIHEFDSLDLQTMVNQINSMCGTNRDLYGIPIYNISDYIKNEIQNYIETGNTTDKFLSNTLRKIKSNSNITISSLIKSMNKYIKDGTTALNVRDELAYKKQILEYLRSQVNLSRTLEYME